MKINWFVETTSTGFTVWLLYMASFETGPFTILILSLIAVALKLQGHLNSMCSENARSMADLIGKLAGMKK